MLAPVNQRGTLQVLLDTNASMKQAAPEQYGKQADWYGAFDTSFGVLTGDYIVASPQVDGITTPFFVAALNWFRSSRLVRCNRVLAVARPAGSAPGGNYYGGDTTTTETPLLTGWPAAVIESGKHSGGEVKLPGDMDMPTCMILLPSSVPLQLRPADVAVDDQPQPIRYILVSAEQTPMGWRCMARTAVA